MVEILGRPGLEMGRAARVGAGELAHLAVERRREEHRLPLLGEASDEAVDLGLEAHVEHPVGLVEDEAADAVERDEPALDEILQPARRCDQDVRAAGGLRLRRDPRAAVDGRNAEILPLGERRELGRDLGRQLAGRHENERGRLAVGGLGALDDRQAEGEGLARAGRRLRQHVEAGERVRKDERLDREWCDDASLLERLRNVSADAERAERLLRHVVVRLLVRGSRQNDSERPKEEREARSHRTTGCRPCSHCSCRGGRRKEVSALC